MNPDPKVMSSFSSYYYKVRSYECLFDFLTGRYAESGQIVPVPVPCVPRVCTAQPRSADPEAADRIVTLCPGIWP